MSNVTTNNLWTPIFTRFWGAEAASFLAAQMFLFALPVIAVSVLSASDSEVGLINTAAGVGTLLFLLVLGAVADLQRKDIILGVLSLLRGLTTASLSYAYFSGALNIWHLLIAAFMVAGLTAVYDSAFSAAVPRVVPVVLLSRANSWIAGLRSAADIGAGALAGLILSGSNPGVLLAFLAVFYFLSSIGPFSLSRIFSREDAAVSDGDGGDEFKGAWQGFSFLLKDPIQRPITLSIAHFNVFTSAIQALYVVYALRYADFTAFEIGVAGSIGGLLGLLAVGPSSRLINTSRPIVILSSTFAVPAISGLLIVALPVVPGFLGVMCLGMSLGLWAGCMLVNIALCETIKQWLVPSAVLGRFSAASRLVTWGVDPVGAALASIAVLFLSIHSVLIISVIGVATSFIWVVTSPSLRDLPIPPNGS